MLEQAQAGAAQPPMGGPPAEQAMPGAAPVDPAMAAQDPQAAQDLNNPGEEPASPEEQAEYERAAGAISSVIYGESGGDKASDTIADGIIAEDKVGSLIQTGITLIAEVDKQIDMDDVVIPQIVEDTVEMLADVAEQKNGIQFQPQDMEAALMGMWEGVMYILGGEAPIEPDYAEATAGMSDEDIAIAQQEYSSRLGAAKQSQEMQQQSVVGGQNGQSG